MAAAVPGALPVAVPVAGEGSEGRVVVAVVGPTATGKSDLGLALAERLGGEVVNVDAMQLYRGMDIGTAKLAVAERRGIPHHQLDVLDVDEDASVARYQRDARADLAGISARGARGVVVGGSGLYVRALLDKLTFPGVDPAVRARLEERAEKHGTRHLHDELARLDPAAAIAIGPANTRRIVRALEVIEITGQPYTANLPEQVYVVPAVQIGLDCDRAVLDERVDRRVDRMWEQGLVEEVLGLLTRGMGRTAARAVGYAEVIALVRGEGDEADARAAVAGNTRRLARKQMTWFGRDQRVHWLDARDPDLVARALEIVAAADRGDLEPGPEPRRTLGA
ncbi:tRNA (adenosine(37)-N6)-dimethylallyltransferase MiaA [Pengzhenrongella sicca]|uniref:tRNA dimethylallyltransferase n=1 Tax=Pengzhenrongella sicca TaxID=2819238 RepID=A0A8A4ZI14_9MICO|nr:tRNA (adenosine(37)-N6)-dimethylallyltransferase MiaA [Pengzhenrongella sicca]QTE30619.1 tRNA (adenosine(37)-N6)-dimethylallyltransferase MiaA [Pengzhenrongella sicca]